MTAMSAVWLWLWSSREDSRNRVALTAFAPSIRRLACLPARVPRFFHFPTTCRPRAHPPFPRLFYRDKQRAVHEHGARVPARSAGSESQGMHDVAGRCAWSVNWSGGIVAKPPVEGERVDPECG